MAGDGDLKGIRVSEAGSAGPNPDPLPGDRATWVKRTVPSHRGARTQGYKELRTLAPPPTSWEAQQVQLSVALSVKREAGGIMQKRQGLSVLDSCPQLQSCDRGRT